MLVYMESKDLCCHLVPMSRKVMASRLSTILRTKPANHFFNRFWTNPLQEKTCHKPLMEADNLLGGDSSLLKLNPSATVTKSMCKRDNGKLLSEVSHARILHFDRHQLKKNCRLAKYHEQTNAMCTRILSLFVYAYLLLKPPWIRSEMQ